MQVVSLCVERCRTDPLPVDRSTQGGDTPSNLAGRTLPELAAATMDQAVEADRRAGRPGVSVRLPEASEFWLGQLFQMLTLAAEIERRLSPFDQNSLPEAEPRVKRIQDRSSNIAAQRAPH